MSQAVLTEPQRIADQLDRAFHGEAWHGPSLQALLEGVTAEQAAARPVQEAHSIWELVYHVTTWHDVARRRLGGEVVEPTGAEDWPAVGDAGEPAWTAARAALVRSYEALHAAVESLGEAQLKARVPGQPYSAYVLLHGVVQHTLYHAGQIALLKKPAIQSLKQR